MLRRNHTAHNLCVLDIWRINHFTIDPTNAFANFQHVHWIYVPFCCAFFCLCNIRPCPQFIHILHVCVTGIIQPHDYLCASEVIWNDMVNIKQTHCSDVIMGALASQITSLTIVYSIVYSDADQTKHQSSASLAFVRGIHRGPVNSPHKWPVTRNMFPFDDVIM